MRKGTDVARFCLLVTFSVAFALVFLAPTTPVSAAPPLQLPWPAGHEHGINGGWTYGCPSGDPYYGTHNTTVASSATAYNADYYAIDFQINTSPLDVAAVAGGTVVLRQNNNDGYGNKIVIDHGGGFYSIYAHFRDPLPGSPTWGPGIEPGTRVGEGRTLGYAGGTGSDPPYPVHLHMHMQSGVDAYRPEPMAGPNGPITGFGTWGYSVENSGNCDTAPADPSPLWKAKPTFNRDFNSNNCSDFMARTGADTVKLYRGTCSLSATGIQIGSGFTGYSRMTQPGDFDGDGCIDLMAVTSGGALKLYTGNCALGWKNSSGITIGSGWNSYLDLIGPGDFDGDGCNDLIARDGGFVNLYLWRGNCGVGGVYWKNNGIATQIGSGWSIFDKIWSSGDFDADGCMDVMARNSAGAMFLYRGGCGLVNGSYWRNNGVGIQVGSGFTSTNDLIGPGAYNSGQCTDVIRRTYTASMLLYAGNCGGSGWFDFGGAGQTMSGSYTGISSLIP